MFADRKWLRRITNGLTLATATLFLTIVGVIALLFAQGIAFQLHSNVFNRLVTHDGVCLSIEILIHLAVVSGFWGLAAPRPSLRAPSPSQDPASRRALRAACVLTLLLMAPSIALRYSEMQQFVDAIGLPRSSEPLFRCLHLAAVLMLILSSLWYLRRIIHLSASRPLCSLAILLFCSIAGVSIPNFIALFAVLGGIKNGFTEGLFGLSSITLNCLFVGYLALLIPITLAIQFEYRNNEMIRKGRLAR